MTDVKRILKYKIEERGPTMLPRGCEVAESRDARIVAVGIQMENARSDPEPFWVDQPVVWVEITYPYEQGAMPALELVPVNLRVVTTGREVGCVGAEYVGTAQVQRDDYNNGAPLVLHVYRCARVDIQMHVDPVVSSVPSFTGPGAGAAGAAMRERVRS